MDKHILITGGTGFIGQRLCEVLLGKGYRLTVLSRQSGDQVKALCGAVRPISRMSEIASLDRLDAVINLAGEGIAEKRWTEARKKELWTSRVDLTQDLVDQLSNLEEAPECLISGSAVGFYGDQGDQTVTEDTQPHSEFSQRMCEAWEDAALRAKSKGLRVCLCRTAPVLGPDSGVIAKMRLPFQMGLGGRLGSGKQYMPWIHIDDEVAAIVYLLENKETEGPYNLCAPNPATNAEFTRTLAHVLHRPAIFPVPSFALKLMLGELSRMLLTGQRAVPKRLQEAGFPFRFRELEPALRDVLGKPAR